MTGPVSVSKSVWLISAVMWLNKRRMESKELDDEERQCAAVVVATLGWLLGIKLNKPNPLDDDEKLVLEHREQIVREARAMIRQSN